MTDRERLIELCNEKIRTMKFQNSDHWYDFTVRTEIIADYLLANDVVKVVRCKDCKHWDKQGFDPILDVDFGDCKCGHLEDEFHNQTDETDFCSYGELKELKDNA